MAFNWFRRQFTQPQPPDTQAEPETASSTEDSVEPAVSTDEEETQKDYLAWAKAAYQNIQQRQQTGSSETEPADITETSETEPLDEPAAEARDIDTEAAESTEEAELRLDASESTEIQSDTQSAAQQKCTAVDSAEQPTLEPETSTTEAEEAESSHQREDQPQSQTESLEPEPAAEEDVEPNEIAEKSSAALPLWARADAERQARLERLKATALEEKVIAPSGQPAIPSAPQIEIAAASPEVEAEPELDEDFLWSAEVLAAQGRRPEEVSADEITWLQKLRQGLGKTRRGVVNQLKTIVGRGPLTQDSVLEIEALLLQADVGIGATDIVIEALQQKMLQETLPPDEAIAYLKKILRDILDAPLQSNYSATFTPQKDTLNIWLMTGVNGAGKTTTIGKLAHVAKESGYVCLVAAADTFRAAAVEQVKVWAGRSGVDVISNPGQNTDPAAVVFDAISAAQSRNIELLLIDTAGRLQNKKNLMDELRKVRQVIDKKAPDAKVESLLVLDATLGQNGLRQAQVFSEAAQLSGVVLTKLDGTAKGGVALAVVQQLGLPIRFIGAGEGIKDLRPFSSYEFVEALLSS